MYVCMYNVPPAMLPFPAASPQKLERCDHRLLDPHSATGCYKKEQVVLIPRQAHIGGETMHGVVPISWEKTLPSPRTRGKCASNSY